MIYILYTFALIIQQQPTFQIKLLRKFSLAEVTAAGKSPTNIFSSTHFYYYRVLYIYYIHHTVIKLNFPQKLCDFRMFNVKIFQLCIELGVY